LFANHLRLFVDFHDYLNEFLIPGIRFLAANPEADEYAQERTSLSGVVFVVELLPLQADPHTLVVEISPRVFSPQINRAGWPLGGTMGP
jgi:hypothetical protein